MNDERSLLLEFDRDDEDFVDGFELGRLWGALRATPDEQVVVELHGRNSEMMLRMAEATGRRVRSEDLDDVWVTVTYEPAGALESP